MWALSILVSTLLKSVYKTVDKELKTEKAEDKRQTLYNYTVRAIYIIQIFLYFTLQKALF